MKYIQIFREGFSFIKYSHLLLQQLGLINFKLPLLFCISTISIQSNIAQVNFIFDQQTKGIEVHGDWKVGKELNVIIRNFGYDKLTYHFEYSSSERTNTNGVTLFNQLSASDVKENKLTAAEKNMLLGSPNEINYITLPIDNKDFSHLKVVEFNGQEKVKERTFSYRNQGGLKFDVSTGFFVSGLKDDVFIIKSDSTGTGFIANEETGEIRVGIGVLAHLHTRCPGILNLGVAGGFELDNDAKVGYLAGGSVFLGYDQKFVLTGGAVFGKKAKISNAYFEGQQVDFSLSVVPTVDVWDVSWFGSLTYNF
ncbi:MAG: hypothetical protein KA330_11895 [Chitinophagaceae bacterium]|nr:hypothetical protein [Chitinophagaceae bacterium]